MNKYKQIKTNAQQGRNMQHSDKYIHTPANVGLNKVNLKKGRGGVRGSVHIC